MKESFRELYKAEHLESYDRILQQMKWSYYKSMEANMVLGFNTKG